MKQTFMLKNLLLAACIAGAGVVSAQSYTSHPAAFTGNFYKDYVGTRLQVSQPSPSSIARDYDYTYAYPSWGGGVDTMTTAPLIDIPVKMGTGASGIDSFGCSAFPAGYFANHIALIWRGPLSSPCEFGTKALNAQTAGARAIVIINEYPGEGPVGMGVGTSGAGASVTIPVFMIGNIDGIAISAAYHTLAADAVKMTIVPWGRGVTNDLGFVPGGVSVWNNAAIPSYQLAGATANAYKGIDGAFIANYGTAAQTNVKLNSSLTFTPVETGTPAVLHTNTVTMSPTSFPTIDSIYALFGPQYDISGITGSGKGRFDLKYDIVADIPDGFPGDNTFTHSFYTTDSIFSKSRYDFTNDHPIASFWTRPGGTPAPEVYMWGVPYFVAKGGAGIKNITFSPCASSGPGSLPTTDVIFYVFKWVDGGPGAAYLDSAIEGAELEMLGTGIKSLNPSGSSDSSFEYFTTGQVTTDSTGSGAGQMIQLADNTWYFIVADMNASMSLGCDGILTQYPRSYGRQHFHNYTELYNPLAVYTKEDMRTLYQDQAFFSYFGGGGLNGNAYDVDSIHYAAQYGLVPSVSFKVTPFKAISVKDVTPLATKFSVYPNPTSDMLNVTLDLVNPAKTVTYTIINSHAQRVSSETKNNVQNEAYSYSTAKLPNGNYYLVITADGRQVFKKFTVLR